MNTIEEAQDWLTERADEGADCPCCGQFVKVYKRKLYSTMAYSLLLIERFFASSDVSWLHVPDFLDGKGVVARGGDFAKLSFWGLLESGEGPRHDGSSRNGMWRITPKGVDFVRGRIIVPKYIFLFNQQCLGFSEEQIHITEALGDDFDYRELME